MYKKLLAISLFFFSTGLLFSQVLPLDISEENILNKNNTISKERFKDITNLYENYFSEKDVDKKGSGYKPFKRWEYQWSHYLLEDGTIAPAETL